MRKLLLVALCSTSLLSVVRAEDTFGSRNALGDAMKAGDDAGRAGSMADPTQAPIIKLVNILLLRAGHWEKGTLWFKAALRVLSIIILIVLLVFCNDVQKIKKGIAPEPQARFCQTNF